MVLVQKWPFFQHFFLGNIAQENVFYDILGRKNAFLGYKNNKFKKFKNWHFCKGVNPWFWFKNGHFSNFFFLCNLGKENVFCVILDRKNAFVGYENNKCKKFKYLPMVLVQKCSFFQLFFFSQFRPREYLLRYSRTKKRLSRL